MSNLSQILRTEENGIEYFTVVATGESGISGVGVARSLGISSEIVKEWYQKLLNPVSTWTHPKSLEPLLRKDSRFQPKGWKGNRKLYTAEFWACLAEYYAFEAKKPTQNAIAVFRSFARIGATSYIQSKTNWLPKELTAAPEVHDRIGCILNEPNPWERLFDENRNKGFAWFGHHFYHDYIYCFLTLEEWCYLNQVNPVRKESNGRCDREYRIHQFIDRDIKDRLEDTVRVVMSFVDVSNTPEEFIELYRRKYQRIGQLNLPLDL